MEKDYFLKRIGIIKPSALKSNNYDSLPRTFLATEEIPIECYAHGLFYQKASSHLVGNNCPVCGEIAKRDGRALTTEEFIFKSKSKFGNWFTYEKTKYTRKDIELIITCCHHGNITMTPDHHCWSKHGCAKCDFEIPRLIKKEKVLGKARKIHGNKYDYSKVIFVNVNNKVEIVCPNHGSFWQRLHEHSVGGNGCPKCSRQNNRLSTDTFIEKSRALHKDRYDYSKVKYKTNASLITIVCKKHGDFIQRAASHLAGNKCKKCHIEESRLSTEDFISKAKDIHGSNYDYSKVVYCGNKKPVEIVCSVHGSFWQKPNTHNSSKNGCRLCNESKGERAVQLFLEKFGINYIREYRIKPNLYRYDFFLPELNVYIEFNGIQHYKPVDVFGGTTGYLSVKKRDSIKKILVEQNYGYLFVITYLSLASDSVESELIKKFKKLWVRTYLIDGKVKTFKSLRDVYNFFNIASNVLIRNLDTEVKKVAGDVLLLF